MKALMMSESEIMSDEESDDLTTSYSSLDWPRGTLGICIGQGSLRN